MNQATSRSTAPARPRQGPWLTAALVIAVVPAVVLLVGIPLHDPTPGSCDAWSGCTASAREQWTWTAQPWATRGVLLGAFIALAVRLAPWFRARPKAVRRGSIIALCLLVPITAVIAFIAVVVWNTQCPSAGWICVGGHSQAIALGSPGVLTGAASLALIVGLVWRNSRAGRVLSTLTLTGLTATSVTVVAAFVAASFFNLLADALTP